jgi:protoheme IX farnesyltransferase
MSLLASLLAPRPLVAWRSAPASTVFCAVIGSLLATDGAPAWSVLLYSAAGIWLLAGAAFAVNCLLEAQVDARMTRTARRATARGDLGPAQTVVFSLVLGGAGAALLYTQVNPLTMWLTLATFVGYAFIYTLLLKPATPQNIVIGGFAGAMPPALGWAAVANGVPLEAWLLVLIIFLWTPPHFWATTTRAPACRCCRSPTAWPIRASRCGVTASRWRSGLRCHGRWA